MHRTFLFAGHIEETPILRLWLNRYKDEVYAADGGAVWCRKMDLQLNGVWGDFDSLDESILTALEKKGVPVYRFNRVKDSTDGELMVEAVNWQPGDKALFVGALSLNRPDHQAGNIALARRLRALGVEVTLTDGRTFIVKMYGKHYFRLDWRENNLFKPDIVSILSENVAQNVTSGGLAYRLDNAIINQNDVVGISNCPATDAKEMTICLGDGSLDVYLLYTDGKEHSVIP